MAILKHYHQIIMKVLKEYAAIKYAYGDIKTEIITDNESNRYLLLAIGWEGEKRIHGCVIHIDIIKSRARSYKLILNRYIRKYMEFAVE